MHQLLFVVWVPLFWLMAGGPLFAQPDGAGERCLEEGRYSETALSGTVRAAAGGLQATLSCRSLPGKDGNKVSVRLDAELGGRTYANLKLPDQEALSNLRIEDLDGDGRAEIVLDTFSGGAHCCFGIWVLRHEARQDTYQPTRADWGNYPPGRAKDLDKDGRFEFVSADNAFAYTFTDFADSVPPIQIWQYSRGSFRNVTRNYPALIRRAAARILQGVAEAKKTGRDMRGGYAAYLATQYLLGQPTRGWQKLRAAYRPSKEAICDKDWPCAPSAYFAKLRAFLQTAGYTKS
ncbi:hypothetical protein [Gloeobacter kilaueensis]|uniref:FG-GAP repeat-containing protein n=1 Tax=Gloeobacter kilaueensis (strain ATCC BAA-2537 / CCAP 1431/1 / ULC 316 / JS1) TaxID=1183438 RepID=U5QHW2_GLOK1|nr:hypothetical protein [Gloeobacter kilaueensis]AGY57214.1 hypothetical protein GKIL_0968 [Gloeobacter kilaueensis JS1]